MISITTALKDAYADIPSGGGTVQGVTYRITFFDYLFTEGLEIYETIIFDYQTHRMGFGFGVK